jgi:SAM-dependent methyltransferase
MNRLEKLIRANELRKTRFHLEYGSLMSWSAWLDLPRATRVRILGTQQLEPWLAPSAVRYLDGVVCSDWRVFEFGAGTSTGWYGKRAAQVVSVEDDPKWYAAVNAQLRESGVRNCDLRFVELFDFPAQIGAFADSSFELIVVDGSEMPGADRLDCLLAAKTKVRPQGLIVFDDSDRLRYEGWNKIVDGWKSRRFVGVRSGAFMATETTLVQRPPLGIGES